MVFFVSERQTCEECNDFEQGIKLEGCETCACVVRKCLVFVVKVIIKSQDGGPRGCSRRRKLLDGDGEVQMYSSSQGQQKDSVA